MSYAQGFMLMREAAKEYEWTLNYGSIALMWRGGCIIRRLVLKSSHYVGTTKFTLTILLTKFNAVPDFLANLCLTISIYFLNNEIKVIVATMQVLNCVPKHQGDEKPPICCQRHLKFIILIVEMPL